MSHFKGSPRRRRLRRRLRMSIAEGLTPISSIIQRLVALLDSAPWISYISTTVLHDYITYIDIGSVLNETYTLLQSPTGRPCQIAKIDTFDVLKEQILRKNLVKFFWFLVYLELIHYFETLVKVRLKARTRRNQKNLRPTFSSKYAFSNINCL